MYEISNGSRYSYFSINEETVNSKPIAARDERQHAPNFESQLKEIEKEEKFLDHLYNTTMKDYQNSCISRDTLSNATQAVILDRISSITSQKRLLDNKKRIVLEKRSVYGDSQPKCEPAVAGGQYNALGVSGSFNAYQQSPLMPLKPVAIVPVKPEPRKFEFWSMELFNYTSTRTLDKHKYLSPDFLLRENRSSYGRYNYTYFNDQPPEEVELFDYTPPPAVKLAPPVATIAPVVRPPPPVHTNNSLATNPKAAPPPDTSRVIYINDIINRSVDSRHVIILRGLPGSGKSTFCQAFKEKEIVNSRSAPRILSVDHFFVEDGKFEYDPDLEPTYRHELFKLFKRQIDEGFFSVILLDCINEKVEQFGQFYQYAKMSRFQVSVLELKVSPTICAKRSEDRFTPAQVYKMADAWEDLPNCFDRLDATSFLQDSSIEDVEMEDIAEEKPAVAAAAVVAEEEEDEEQSASDDEDSITETGFFKSKWDEDFEDTKERLDGVKQVIQPALSIKEYLKIEMENLSKSNIEDKGKGKHVKWADFEELKKQKRRKELGFVAGNTDWTKLMSSDIDVAEAALVQVQFFTKDSE